MAKVVKVAVMISTFNRKELLKRSLDSLFNSFDKIKPEIYLCDDGSDEPVKDERINYLLRNADNMGLRFTLNILLKEAMLQGDYKYICYCQDDIEYKKGWLDKCVEAWNIPQRQAWKDTSIGFVTGHDAPEHAVKNELEELIGNNLEKILIKDTCRATHLFASTKRWKQFGEIPDLTPGIAAPKPGHGSLVDWWLVGHPEKKYPQSNNSLQNKGEKVLCIPELIKHIGSKASTWGIQTPERQRLIPNRVGVQIITRNRPEYLATLLSSLRNQTFRMFDLFIVDNSDTSTLDNHQVKSILMRMEFEGHRIKVVADPTRDIGYLRNIALDMDDCEFGIRIDDDSICEPDMLERLLKVAKRSDKVGCVGPLVPFMQSEKLFKELPPKMCRMTKFYDLTDESIYFYNTDKEYVECDHVRSSMMYRNEIAKKVRHPEGFGKTGWREETVFSYRFTIHGYQNYYVPKAICWHFMAPSGGGRDNDKDPNEQWFLNDQKMKEVLSNETLNFK